MYQKAGRGGLKGEGRGVWLGHPSSLGLPRSPPKAPRKFVSLSTEGAEAKFWLSASNIGRGEGGGKGGQGGEEGGLGEGKLPSSYGVRCAIDLGQRAPPPTRITTPFSGWLVLNGNDGSDGLPDMAFFPFLSLPHPLEHWLQDCTIPSAPPGSIRMAVHQRRRAGVPPPPPSRPK